MTDRLHRCPAPECSEMVKYTLFACSRDWFRLPAVIRARMWAAYRVHDDDRHQEAMVEAVTWYANNPR